MTPRTPRKRKTKIEKAHAARALRKPKSKIEKVALPPDLSRPMSITKFAAAYQIDPSTVWRGLRDGRLQFITVHRRKLIMPPRIEQAASSD
jgi:hypothetical protein